MQNKLIINYFMPVMVLLTMFTISKLFEDAPHLTYKITTATRFVDSRTQIILYPVKLTNNGTKEAKKVSVSIEVENGEINNLSVDRSQTIAPIATFEDGRARLDIEELEANQSLELVAMVVALPGKKISLTPKLLVNGQGLVGEPEKNLLPLFKLSNYEDLSGTKKLIVIIANHILYIGLALSAVMILMAPFLVYEKVIGQNKTRYDE